MEDVALLLGSTQSAIRAALTVGLPPGTASDPGGQVEHLTSPDAIRTRFEQLAYTAITSIESLMPVPAIRNDAATIGYARDLAVLGAHIRTAPVLPHRLFLCDRRIALVPLDPDTGGRGVACVTAPGVVATLIEFFEALWHHATPLDSGWVVLFRRPGMTVTPHDGVLLALAGLAEVSEH